MLRPILARCKRASFGRNPKEKYFPRLATIRESQNRVLSRPTRSFPGDDITLEPISHFIYSDRLKLQFWDYGQDAKPALVLIHGALDHARNWDWVARSFREQYHVYALDLRGHGNSAWAPGAMYSVLEHVLDLSGLLDIVDDFPIRLVGHSLGGIVVLHYAGVYPERVLKAISIEGIGFPPKHRVHGPASERLRHWIEAVRNSEGRVPRSFHDLDA